MHKLVRVIPPRLRRRLEVFLIDHGWPSPRRAGAVGIERYGHRGYVGAAELYDDMGLEQFEFMVQHGLQPDDVLCDVGCGSLRGGCRFIDYLQPGHYLGLEGESKLLELGIRYELDDAEYRARRPEFVISYEFEFHKFSRSPTFALAVSVFTHLTEGDIRRCLANLADHLTGPCQFFASFFESDEPMLNFRDSHSQLGFYHTREQMERFGSETGWTPTYIGEWGSPAGQQMMKYSIDR